MADEHQTLYQSVAGCFLHNQHKHGLGETYTEDNINAMSKHEFLQRISEALEEAGVMPKKEA